MGVVFELAASIQIASDNKADRVGWWIDLTFRNVMSRCCLMRGVGMSMSRVRARWSESVSVRLKLVRLLMVIPVVQIRSRVCPFLWVGKSTCCVMLKELRISRNSVAVAQEAESTCKLKSPRSNTDGEMAQS